MADEPVIVPVVTPPKTWPDVADNVLHYVAGAAVLAIGFLGVYIGKISADVFTPLLFGAAAAIGFKMAK